LTPESGKLDGPRRRRRRRGRRRDREQPEGTPSASQHADFGSDVEDEDDLDLDEPLELEVARRAPAEHDELHVMDDFDFGDEIAGPDEDSIDEFPEDRAPAAVDEEIDPELEEEIRREIAEIAELEREMGLRGPVEARPRRGDDREPDAGRGGRFTRGRGLV
jgi:ribonuclease E